jgi:SAM-dependent methyltransferase
VPPLRVLDEDGLEKRPVVLMVDRALRETREAFDGVAAEYDRTNAENRLLSAMRRQVLDVVQRSVAPGAHLLDLGCGPGCDAESLARKGFRVTGIDWSGAMVEEARSRVVRSALGDRVEVAQLGIQELDRLPAFGFDAAYSNFGPLNCVPDLSDAAHQIGRRLRHGGVLVASVIGRVCPWEIALYTCRGNLARACVRFANGFVPVPLKGRTVWTHYYRPREFEAAFHAAGFRRQSLRALGLLAPPPYMEAFAGRHPSLVSTLLNVDGFVGVWPGLRSWGDHFLMVLERV